MILEARLVLMKHANLRAEDILHRQQLRSLQLSLQKIHFVRHSRNNNNVPLPVNGVARKLIFDSVSVDVSSTAQLMHLMPWSRVK